MEGGRIDVNEALRATVGTNIDFVGVDLYKAQPYIFQTILPYKGANYRMIMEAAAEVPDAAQMQLTALSGNNAYDHYDLCSPDGHSLYDRTGENGLVPHGKYVDQVRTVNKLLNSDQADIAKLAQGYGLFVHNWTGKSGEPTEGVEGIIFKPSAPTSQAISINRSPTEIVLMNTTGGVFTLPDSMSVSKAGYGYFDKNDKWMQTGSLTLTGKSISPSPGTTIRLTRIAKGSEDVKKLQAEFASYGLGSTVEAKYLGFAGNGYVAFNDTGGNVRWSNVDGLSGGERNIRIRYANGSSAPRNERLTINKTPSTVTFPPTGSWEKFKTINLKVMMNSGATNSISIDWIEQGPGNIDELQIVK